MVVYISTMITTKQVLYIADYLKKFSLLECSPSGTLMGHSFLPSGLYSNITLPMKQSLT